MNKCCTHACNQGRDCDQSLMATRRVIWPESRTWEQEQQERVLDDALVPDWVGGLFAALVIALGFIAWASA